MTDILQYWWVPLLLVPAAGLVSLATGFGWQVGVVLGARTLSGTLISRKAQRG